MRATHTTRRISQIQDDLKHCAPPDPESSWPSVARGASIVVSTRAPRGHPVQSRQRIYKEWHEIYDCATCPETRTKNCSESCQICQIWTKTRTLTYLCLQRLVLGPNTRTYSHSSPSRCWWREGDLGPSEYGNAGANSQTRSISRGAVAQGSELDDVTIHQTKSMQCDAPYQDWHAGPAGFPPTMGRGDASPRQYIDIVILRTLYS